MHRITSQLTDIPFGPHGPVPQTGRLLASGKLSSFSPFFTHFRPLLNAAGFSSKASNIDTLRQRRTQHLLRLQSCSFNSTLEREMKRFRTVIEAPFRKTPDGKRILQCHSRGDRRFSPFCCFLEAFGQTNSIENHYQRAKVFEGELHPKDWKQAKHFKKSGLKQTSWQIGPHRLPCVTNSDGNSFPVRGPWYPVLHRSVAQISPRKQQPDSNRHRIR